jgi:hypothetical protein
VLTDAEVNAKGLKTAFQGFAALAGSSRDRSLLKTLERKAARLEKDAVLNQTVRFRHHGNHLDAHVTVHNLRLRRGLCDIEVRSKDGPVANELEAILQQVSLPPDPNWDKLWDQRRREDRLIAGALATVGLRAASIYWLVNDKVQYGPEVAPPLLHVLPRIHEKMMREGIFRALRMPRWPLEVRNSIVDTLMPLLLGMKDQESRWELGMVLRGITPPSKKALLKKAMDGARLTPDEQAAFEAMARPRRAASTVGTARLPTLKNAAEASTNLDMDELRGVLNGVSKVVDSGFGSSEIKTVLAMAKSMEVDEERALDFKVRHVGRAGTLRVAIFLDDVDAPDLYLRSDLRDLIKQLDGKLASL